MAQAAPLPCDAPEFAESAPACASDLAHKTELTLEHNALLVGMHNGAT